MRKRSKRILSSLLGLLCACLIGGGVNHLLADSTPSPVETVAATEGYEASAQNATIINYDGTPTGRYAVETYAGRADTKDDNKSFAYIVANQTVLWTDYGKDAHPIGSNVGEGNGGSGRLGFQLVFKINCTSDCNAYLWLYVSGDVSQTATYDGYQDGNATPLWHDGGLNMQSQRVRKGQTGAHFPVVLYMPGLKQGLNNIYLTLGDNYTAWFHSFAISSTGERTTDGSYAVQRVDVTGLAEAGTVEKIPISLYKSYGGDFSVDYESFGVNAFDNPEDYGKKGSVTFEFNVKQAGVYKVGLWAIAGQHIHSNRMGITVNGNKLSFDGKPYVSLAHTAINEDGTWDTYADALNNFYLHFKKGVNTFVISNELTYVDPNDKSKEKAQADGGVGVSNWWVHRYLEFTLIKACDIAVSGNALANPGQQITGSSITVTYKEEDSSTVLNDYDYTTGIPFAKRVDDGTTATTDVWYTKDFTDGDVSKAVSLYHDNYTVKSTIEGGARTLRSVVPFDGTSSTGKKSYYHNVSIANDSNTYDRLYWIADYALSDGGYRIGSNGAGNSENRQATFNIKINNTGEAGTYLFKSYGVTNHYNYDKANVSTNGGSKTLVNMFNRTDSSGTVVSTFVTAIDLVSGQNTLTIEMQEQYAVWFDYFEICPLDTDMKYSYSVMDGARSGNDIVDTNDNTWVALTEERTLRYWVNALADGSYTFMFNTSVQSVDENKSLTLSIDGNANTVALNGAKTVKDVTLSKGVHEIAITLNGDAGNFTFNNMNLTYGDFDAVTASIRVKHDVVDGTKIYNGIRFHIAMSNAVYEALKDAPDFETGTIVIMRKRLTGDLNLETKGIAVGNTTNSWFEKAGDTNNMYSVAYINNVPEAAYESEIVARGYIKANGQTYYTALSGVWSMAYVAEEADKVETNPVIQNLLKAFYLKYDVTFTDENGADLGSQTGIRHGSLIADAPTEYEDKQIVGWLLNGEVFDIATTPLTGNVTLVAVYESEQVETEPETEPETEEEV